MKQYIEYPIIWIITSITYFLLFTSPTQDLGLRIILTLIFGSAISAAAYMGYKSIKKKKN